MTPAIRGIAQPAGSRRGGGDHVGLGAGQATPSPASVLDQSGPVSSLPSLATPASLVDAIWGMGNVAVAGYDGNNSAYSTESVLAMPQTLLAAGNDPLSLPAFTSETIVGAEGVFYADDVAVAIPTTRATPLIGYGTSGVSAGSNAPVNVSDGVDWSAAVLHSWRCADFHAARRRQATVRPVKSPLGYRTLRPSIPAILSPSRRLTGILRLRSSIYRAPATRRHSRSPSVTWLLPCRTRRSATGFLRRPAFQQ